MLSHAVHLRYPRLLTLRSRSYRSTESNLLKESSENSLSFDDSFFDAESAAVPASKSAVTHSIAPLPGTPAAGEGHSGARAAPSSPSVPHMPLPRPSPQLVASIPLGGKKGPPSPATPTTLFKRTSLKGAQGSPRVSCTLHLVHFAAGSIDDTLFVLTRWTSVYALPPGLFETQAVDSKNYFCSCSCSSHACQEYRCAWC